MKLESCCVSQAALTLFLLAGSTACSHMGPGTVARDRSEYSSAVADSWKQQTLLNIVKLRYMDLPVFLDVGQIVSGYTLEQAVNVNGQVSSETAIQGNSVAVGGSGRFTDRPTITYLPMTGDEFLRGLFTPVNPRTVFSMLQSGYAADFVLALTVESLNGLRNRATAAGAMREADPDFLRALGLIRDIQAEGGLGVRVEDDKGKGQTTVLFFRRDKLAPETLDKIAQVRQLLKLSPEQDRFKLVFSPVAGADDELAVNTRSMLQMMSALASYIQIPPEDVKDGRAVPAPANPESPDAPKVAVSIRCDDKQPTDAFASVHYRNHWFWIDDKDWRSKRAFSAIMFFFTLAEGSSREQLPVLTIPAGG